jgi:undecaprenyl-diphosphatase
MDIIELIKTVLLGIVEGITEWLPISSTGHLIIADDFIKLNVSDEFWQMFLVVVQLGAIIAVIVLYFSRLNPFSWKKTPEQRQGTWRLWGKVVLACIPAAIVGVLFDSWMEENLHNAVTVCIALVFYGIAFIVVERVKSEKPRMKVVGAHSREAGSAASGAGSGAAGGASADGGQGAWDGFGLASGTGASGGVGSDAAAETENLSIPKAMGIGVFQCLAIVPGTSRSGSTILGGRLLGVSREAAAEFSFFLAIPVMFGWSLLKLVKTYLIDGAAISFTEIIVFIVGVLVAFSVSVVAIKFLMGFIKKHSFEAFGWYRIALGGVLLAYFAITGRLFVIGG